MTTRYDPKKLLGEKKGQIKFLDKSKGISQRQEDKQGLANNDFNKLVHEIAEYTDFILRSAEDLRDIRKEEFVREFKAYLRNSDREIARHGVRKEYQEKDGFNPVNTEGIFARLHKNTETLRQLRTKVNLSDEAGSEQHVTDLKNIFKEVADDAGKCIKLFYRIDAKKCQKFAVKNNTIIHKIADKFVTCINKIKSAFGFHDGRKREILGDIQTTLDKAKTSITAKLQ